MLFETSITSLLAESENRVYLWYRYCSKLLEKLRKKREFRQHRCRNSNKKYERGKVNDVIGEGRKNLNFGNEITEIIAAWNSCPAAKWSARGRSGWKETNCGNQVVEIVGEWGERK